MPDNTNPKINNPQPPAPFTGKNFGLQTFKPDPAPGKDSNGGSPTPPVSKPESTS